MAIFAAFRTIGRRPFRFRNPPVVSANIIAIIYPEENGLNGRFIIDRREHSLFYRVDEKMRD
jgi:hypothetical protein